MFCVCFVIFFSCTNIFHICIVLYSIIFTLWHVLHPCTKKLLWNVNKLFSIPPMFIQTYRPNLCLFSLKILLCDTTEMLFTDITLLFTTLHFFLKNVNSSVICKFVCLRKFLCLKHQTLLDQQTATKSQAIALKVTWQYYQTANTASIKCKLLS